MMLDITLREFLQIPISSLHSKAKLSNSEWVLLTRCLVHELQLENPHVKYVTALMQNVS